MPEPLDFALIKRLREVLDDRPATESELRLLTEQAEAWARTVGSQIESSERRIRRLDQNPSSSLAQIAAELKRVEQLRPQLNEVRTLIADLEERAREVRTKWLLSQATSAKEQNRRSAGRPRGARAGPLLPPRSPAPTSRRAPRPCATVAGPTRSSRRACRGRGRPRRWR